MTKLAITIAITLIAASSQASEMFSACEHVSDLAVLAKDNVPFFTTNRNSNVKECYADIKEFVAVATHEDIAQFNDEYAGQIVIHITDADFASHVNSKKSADQAFVIQTPKVNSLTPVIKPFAPQFFAK